MGKKVIRHL